MSFNILTVCTGNVCRSPLAEQLLRVKLDAARFEIASAGAGALVDHPMPAPALDIANGLDLPHPEQHRGRRLTSDLVVEADLVIAMAREHRSQVVQMFPRANRYTYTLLELARIANAIPDDELKESVVDRRNVERAAFRAISELRGIVPPPESQDELDIIDPYRREVDVYEQSSAAIVEAVDAVVDYINRAHRLAQS